MFLDHPALQSIRALMEDPDVTEIMINGPSQVYVERRGVMQPHALDFRDERQLDLLVAALLQPQGRSVSPSTPYVDFRLPDGSRGNVIVAPLAVSGTTVTIRKFTKRVTTASDLMRVGTISKRMAHLLATAVKGKANIVFSAPRVPARPPPSASSAASFPRPSGSSRSRTRRNSSCSRSTWCDWNAASRTSKGRGPSPFRNCSETPCACGRRGSSWARCEATRLSI